jgi:hypothetical protein
LRLLELVHSPNRHPDLPSWVPDFNDEPWRKGLPKNLQGRGFFGGRKHVRGALVPFTRPLRTERYCLSVRGEILGTIRAATEQQPGVFAYKKTDDPAKWTADLLSCAHIARKWVVFTAKLDPFLNGDKPIMRVIHAMLRTEEISEQSEQKYLALLETALTPWVGMLNAIANQNPQDENFISLDSYDHDPIQFYKYWAEDDHVLSAITDLEASVSSNTMGRSLFFTENLLGTVDGSARVGDMVVLFHAAEQPMVIRESRRRHVLVGPAYLDRFAGRLGSTERLRMDYKRLNLYKY